MAHPINVAVVGATGAVGREMVLTLEQRKFPVVRLRLFASPKSVGRTLRFRGEDVPVELLSPTSFEATKLALFSAGNAISREFAPLAVKAGVVVIDNSSAFRMDPEVDIIVPEVNKERVRHDRMLYANPNCATAALVMALKPIYDRAGLRRVVVTSLQSVSGAGAHAVQELEQESRALLQGQSYTRSVFPHQIAFNVIPQIPQANAFALDGSAGEETKICQETRKILGDPHIRISVTCVRVPVYRGHSLSVNIETARRLSARDARELIRAFPGVEVIDDPAKQLYPMPIMVDGKDAVLVGRIREDASAENGLQLWIVGDNLRKGAALNAVQIAERVLEVDASKRFGM